MQVLARLGPLVLGLCCAAGAPLAASQAAGPHEVPRSGRALEKVRERLQTLPPDERARLERRLEEFEKLPPQARMKLLERARALRERERSAGESAPRELRSKLERLDAARAREEWNAHLREHFRERGRAVRARLPEKLRERLEHAPPEARRRFLERLFQERDPVSRKALERMQERGLSGREIRRLESMPLPERLHAMLELRAARAGSGASGARPEREGSFDGGTESTGFPTTVHEGG